MTFIKQDLASLLACRIERYNSFEKENAELKKQLKLWRKGATQPIVGKYYFLEPLLLYERCILMNDILDPEDDEFEFIGLLPSYRDVLGKLIDANPPYYQFRSSIDEDIYIYLQTHDLHWVCSLDADEPTW